MSKLIFSTLSILALLLLETNCSTGIRGGGGGGSQPCKEELVLNPGDGCSGPDYSFLNSAGHLIPKGSYFDSNGYVHQHGETETINNGTRRTFLGHFISGDLYLTRNDKAWTIISLP